MKPLNLKQHMFISMLLRMAKIANHGLLESLSENLPQKSPERVALDEIQISLMTVKQSLESRLYDRYREDGGAIIGEVYRDMISLEQLEKLEDIGHAVDE